MCYQSNAFRLNESDERPVHVSKRASKRDAGNDAVLDLSKAVMNSITLLDVHLGNRICGMSPVSWEERNGRHVYCAMMSTTFNQMERRFLGMTVLEAARRS